MLAGESYQTFTLSGAVYPTGPLQIVLLVPSATISCPGSLAQARVETLGHVGERIYQEELHSPDVTETLHHMEDSTVFQRAVAAGDATKLRRAAHTLKGAAATFGAEETQDAALCLEEMGRNAQLAGAEVALAALDTALTRLRAALPALRVPQS